MIIPAVITPRVAARNDFFLSIFKSAAIKHPVQAPVPGSGIPTNKNKPQYFNFSILSNFLSQKLSYYF